MTYIEFAKKMKELGYIVTDIKEPEDGIQSRFEKVNIYNNNKEKLAEISKDSSFHFDIFHEFINKEFNELDNRKIGKQFLYLIIELSCTPVPER